MVFKGSVFDYIFNGVMLVLFPPVVVVSFLISLLFGFSQIEKEEIIEVDEKEV